MKNVFTWAMVFAAVHAFAGLPTVTSVAYEQGAKRVMLINYTSDAEAIITADVQVDGVSFGATALTNMTGDVNCVVPAGEHTIAWDIRAALPRHADIRTDSVRVALTAWPKDNPPDILVADLTNNAPDVVRYYTSLEALPGGILDNPVYRESKLVLKRVHAAGLSCDCGAPGGSSKGYTAYSVSVRQPSDYYLAIFEMTQQQMTTLGITPRGSWSWKGGDHPEWKPCVGTPYYRIRENSSNETNVEHQYPNAPHPDSYLGMMRTRTGIAFDLPTETQWEFVARAGYPTGYWGDGKIYEYYAQTDANLSACYAGTGGRANGADECGYHGFNSWSFADMSGNASEVVLDCYADNPTTVATFIEGAPYMDGTANCVVKGGSFNDWAYSCYPWKHGSIAKSSTSYYYGFRVVAPIPAELP